MSTEIITVLVLLGPGIIASLLHTHLQHGQPPSKENIWYALIYAFIINWSVFGLITLTGKGDSLVGDMLSTISSAAKYGGLALLAALTFPSFYTLISKITTRVKA